MKNKDILILFNDQFNINYQDNLINIAKLLNNTNHNIYIYDKFGIYKNPIKKAKFLTTKELSNKFFDIVFIAFYQQLNFIKDNIKCINIINIWHGWPLRKINNDHKLEKIHFKKNSPKNIFFIVPNEFYSKIFVSAFRVKKENIFINEAIFTYNQNFKINKLFQKRKKLILFAPTHDLSFRNKNIFDRFHQLVNFENVNNNFNNEFEIHIKTHPLDNINIPSIKNIKVLDRNFSLENNFNDYDFFMTDLSSAVVNWINLTNKKFVLISPGLDYIKQNGLYFKYEDLFFDELESIDGILKYFTNKKVNLYKNFHQNVKYNKNCIQKIISKYKLIRYLSNELN